ncbi:TetR/AcrR family transcriptional regulator [Clavibacter michiganensis]|uniref:TetR/AcrR family transcriptional regulator n=1 Tax=Clavibacter michiganensis TaxID=28447 RepID=UPI0005BB328B|nr:TetR/AcrR family transcriptional regulator C-terminal domain-containing protein [Clavibacter michiganensis]
MTTDGSTEEGGAATAPTRARGRQRASHSLDTVLAEAIAILDESGERALTFRALAARLGGGVASIYWYVASRDELLERATEEVMGRVLADSEPLIHGSDPVENVRAVALALFDELVRRPWFGQRMLRSNGLQHNSMAMYERLGQQLLTLDLTPRQRFHAVSSIVSYVVGVAADLAEPPPKEFLESGLDREGFLGTLADRWRDLDPEEFPFAHDAAGEMAAHDDLDVFRSGLDLLLAGLRQQAGLPPAG